MKRIFFSIIVIGMTIALVVRASSAFFSDTETSTGNVLGAGDIDLTINGENDPEGIVDFDDLKPGDNYIEDKTLRVGSNPAWVWMHIFDVETGQGLQTEPEELEEGGTPKHDIHNYLTYDLEIDGDVLISQEDEVGFGDVVSCWIPLGELPGGVDVLVNQSFHLPFDVGNWAQGDSMSFSEEFAAVQSRNNPNPTPPDSDTGRVWSEETRSCNSDLLGQWDLVFSCVSGCSGDYPHTMDITSSDAETGEFGGDGFYNPNPGISWNILNGSQVGSGVEFRIDYNNINPSYFVDLVGTVNLDGSMEGTANSSVGQTFTWVASK